MAEKGDSQTELLRKSKLSITTVLSVTKFLEEIGAIKTELKRIRNGKARIITFVDNDAKQRAICLLNSIKGTYSFFLIEKKEECKQEIIKRGGEER